MFSDLLNETKGFKYQITLKVMLKKYKPNGEIKFIQVYFNSPTKTVIKHKFSLENVFQEILYRIDNWINEGSGWIVKLIESLRCHVRHINPVKIHPEKITREKRLANDLDYDKAEFHVRQKDFSKIQKKNNICINVFCYENKLVFPIYVSDQNFENSMDLLLVFDENKSHYVYIKDFDRFMFHKTKNKNKKYFCKSCLQCFSSKNVLTKHKEVCLSINGAQSVRLEKGTIKFKSCFKQIPVPFKIYADERYEGSYTKKYQDHIPCSFAYKLVCVDDKFIKPIAVFRGKNATYKFIEAILEQHFNKNLIMSEKKEEKFRLSNTC